MQPSGSRGHAGAAAGAQQAVDGAAQSAAGARLVADSAQATPVSPLQVQRPAAPAAQAQADSRACLQTMRMGSRTFFLAAQLLPRALLRDFAAVYAFCREADDAIDEATAPVQALGVLQLRLAAVGHAAGASEAACFALPTATDRALARVVRARTLSLVPLQALLEGFAWDACNRTYPTLAATLAYCARAAGSIGVLLTQLLHVNAPWALARAADMGVAMQLTNICRDVGEDARMGRVYLPATWLAQEGLSPADVLGMQEATPALRRVVARTLRLAETLYARARTGLVALPLGARLAVAAASRLYADIGRSIARNGFDSVQTRAYVRAGRKGLLVGRALLDLPPVLRWKAAPRRSRGPLRSCAFLLGHPDIAWALPRPEEGAHSASMQASEQASVQASAETITQSVPQAGEPPERPLPSHEARSAHRPPRARCPHPRAPGLAGPRL